MNYQEVDKKPLARWLSRLRCANKKSVAQAAKGLAVNTGTIYRMENGESSPRIAFLADVCQYYNVCPSSFWAGKLNNPLPWNESSRIDLSSAMRDWLVLARVHARFSVKKASAKSKIHPTSISNFEYGETSIKITHFEALCETYNKAPAEFWCGVYER